MTSRHNYAQRPQLIVTLGMLVAAGAALLLSACSTTAPGSHTTDSSSGSPTRHVHYVQILKTLTVGAANLGEEAAQTRAKELGNVTLTVEGPPEADPAEQVQEIETAISDKVDGLIVDPLDDSVCKATGQAIAAGIPTITFDSGCTDVKHLTYVGTNNYAGGYAAGLLYAQHVQGKGQQRIGILTGEVGATNLEQRDAGFVAGLKAKKVPFKIVTTISGNDDDATSVQILESTLRGNASINGFFFDGPWPLLVKPSTIPETVARAKAGMTIVSFDAIQPEMDALRSGLAVALVSQDYYGMSYQAVQVLDQMVRHGGKFGSTVSTKLFIVTKNGGPTWAGPSISADEQDHRWDTNDWPETPVIASNLKK